MGDIIRIQTDITRPVTSINWWDAVIWCNAYSELSDREPVYYKADGVSVLRTSSINYSFKEEADKAIMKREKNGYRLPTEVGALKCIRVLGAFVVKNSSLPSKTAVPPA